MTKDKPRPLVDEGGGKENKPKGEEENMKRQSRTASNKAKERIQVRNSELRSKDTIGSLLSKLLLSTCSFCKNRRN